MGISRIEIQGQIARAQDFTNIKHQEDHKGQVEQAVLHNQTKKNDAVKLTRVQNAEQTDGHQMNHHDAKEKGKNSYAGDGGSHRREHEEASHEPDGKVLLKSMNKRKVADKE